MAHTVLITGASSGIGLETALYLAERGSRVVATMRNLEKRTDLDRAAAARGAHIEVEQLDVTDGASIERAAREIAARHGNIDALVLNAGIQIRGYFEDLSPEEIRRVYETNVFGTMAVTRQFLPSMRLAGRGRIVLISSVGGRIGTLGLSAYCSSKFALEGFGECLALELTPLGIGVSLVEPGIVNTEIWGKNRWIAEKALQRSSPYRQWFEREEELADWALHTSPIRPLDVAKAVHHALTARRPRLRYLVGRRASFVLAARRYLPSEWFEKMYCKFLTSRVARSG